MIMTTEVTMKVDVAVRGLIASHWHEFMTWFFPFLKVSTLEWWGKGRHLKKSTVNPAGLKTKTFGINVPCLLHEMCWCHQRGFFYRSAQNFVRKEWHITKGPAFIGTSEFICGHLSRSCVWEYLKLGERGSNNKHNLNIIINSNNSSGCSGSISSSSSNSSSIVVVSK